MLGTTPAQEAPLSHSLTTRLAVNCPRCGVAWEGETWIILDTAERPDLLALVADGRFNLASCANCGDTGQLDTPLLVYTPRPAHGPVRPAQGDRPAPPDLSSRLAPLVLVVLADVSPQKAAEYGGELLAILREMLGYEWRDAWLSAGLPRMSWDNFKGTVQQALGRAQSLHPTFDREIRSDHLRPGALSSHWPTA